MDHSLGAPAEQLGPVRAEPGSELVERMHEAVVELYEHCTSSHDHMASPMTLGCGDRQACGHGAWSTTASAGSSKRNLQRCMPWRGHWNDARTAFQRRVQRRRPASTTDWNWPNDARLAADARTGQAPVGCPIPIDAEPAASTVGARAPAAHVVVGCTRGADVDKA